MPNKLQYQGACTESLEADTPKQKLKSMVSVLKEAVKNGQTETKINKKLISQFPTGSSDGSANFADNLTGVLACSQDLC